MNPGAACIGCCLTAGRLLMLGLALHLSAAHAQDAASLRERHAALHDQFASSPFGRPLVLESMQTEGALEGSIHAIVDHPYRVVGSALSAIGHWCDILMVHLNVKGCRTQRSGAADVLSVFVGRKFDQPLADAYQVDFGYRVAARGPDYLQVLLHADTGPLGTTNYRIVLEAAPLDARRSLVHMAYSYGYGGAAKLAMKAYLGTIGRNKVGFTIVSRTPEGTPVYIDGERGVVERNTMRYYLAIEAYLAAQAVAPAERPERRLREWFAAIERHPQQLHELERDDYLQMKRRELARMAPKPRPVVPVR